ncbi:MAG: DNA (cytosine-5-)-methyltransferase [Alcaligenaceae bacterium]|nr:MAG: DNA (cytosine-5-)-methyltransferase [Alcaligenaceae bacterium]
MKVVEALGAAGKIKFLDLCAGLGGFHRGLSTAAQTATRRFGAQVEFECVAAAELETDLRKAYVSNFSEIVETYRRLHGKSSRDALQLGLDDKLNTSLPTFDERGTLTQVHGDIACFLDEDQTGLRLGADGQPLLPAHDLLCAGFPCQPFSKSGAQLGLEDTRGTVFHTIATILRECSPAFVFLENVGNFAKHDGGNTWLRVKKILEEDLGYDVIATHHVGEGSTGGLLSPHHLGHPHHRERFFIVGQRRSALSDDSKLVKSLLKRPLKHARVFPSARLNGALSPAANRLLDQKAKKSLLSIISKNKSQDESAALLAAQISPDRVRCINHWGALLAKLEEIDAQTETRFWKDSMPSFPIWGYELDPWHWYPIEDNPALHAFDLDFLSSHRKQLLQSARTAVLDATFGTIDIKSYAPAGERAWLSGYFTAPRIAGWVESWPAYAGGRDEWPRWKQRFIAQNRQWAIKLWSALDPVWLRGWLDILYTDIRVASFQKLEWNCKGEELDIWAHILQFRPSGLRVKRLAHVPALVAMTTTQIPIVPRLNLSESLAGAVPASRGRHLVISEALELQGFPVNWSLPSGRERVFACFGNAVHVGVVHDVAMNWFFVADDHASTKEVSEQSCGLLKECLQDS